MKKYKFSNTRQQTLNLLYAKVIKKRCPTCGALIGSYCMGKGITVDCLHMTRVLLTYPKVKSSQLRMTITEV